jgi:hypothetical protein
MIVGGRGHDSRLNGTEFTTGLPSLERGVPHAYLQFVMVHDQHFGLVVASQFNALVISVSHSLLRGPVKLSCAFTVTVKCSALSVMACNA